MARTVAGRPLSAADVIDRLTVLLDRDRAIRIVAIADAFGVKAESLPTGMVTIHVVSGGYRMEVQI